MATIDIEGNAFAVRTDGSPEAPALLLSNSLGSDMSMWDEQVPHWSKRFRVVRYDARGHGRTAVSPGPYTIDRLGRDALAVLDALHIERAHFCGLSMGGMMGMWLMSHAGGRIARAVLANTSAHMPPRSLWDERMAQVRENGMNAIVEGTLERWLTPAFRAKEPGAVERVRTMILRTPVEGYLGCCAAIRDMDQREAIRSIRTPTLVIIGAHDPSTTPEAGEAIHRAIAGSEVTTLEAAHLSNVEQPIVFATAVERFLLR
ncbi:MAG TPA: 3-oxoadipate enol-lactonase [Casimicrobiaceae bacterium]|nr:3-oxoadipate enol-lactonase [Casimicrobiaceae bacterium]